MASLATASRAQVREVDNRLLTQSAPSGSAAFGYIVATGDFSDDGWGDVICGGPGHDIGFTQAVRVVVSP